MPWVRRLLKRTRFTIKTPACEGANCKRIDRVIKKGEYYWSRNSGTGVKYRCDECGKKMFR